jgi:predicted DCC family thiol-disulfide oxidoreductase YuxK
MMTEAERAKIESQKTQGRPVLLYDGVCALCNGMVKFVLRHDRDGVFLFAALASDPACQLLGANASVQDSVAVVLHPFTPRQIVLRRSDAVIEALRLLGWSWSARLLAVVPRWLRETGYGVVARVRYRLFGRYEVCPLPSPEVRARFLGV